MDTDIARYYPIYCRERRYFFHTHIYNIPYSPGVTFPLGMKENSTYEERNVQLHRGDIVLLLTNRITEAMNTQKELFGVERLE